MHPPSSQNPLVALVKESALAALVALIIFGPIVGLVLQGYEFEAHPMRPVLLALGVFVGRILIGLWQLKRPQSTRSTARLPQVFQNKATQAPLLIAFCALLIAVPFITGKYWLSVFNLALIYVLLGLGLNIVVGLAGLLDLGFVAFYAVGAYGYALGSQYLGLGFWSALVLAGALAALCGAMLGFPVLRLHGDYLAIVTLGFGEIISLVLTNWTSFTGGPNGVNAPPPTLFGLEFRRRANQGGVPFHEFFGLEYSSIARYVFLYFSLLIVVGIAIAFVVRLKKMPIGRAWEALRENEIACKALGINHVGVKLTAFSLGAMIGGVAGVFFAGFQGFIDPLSFTFFESALILAIVVLGGMGSTVGVIISAIVLTIAPEFLREFSDYRILIFGLLMVFMMIWKPRGLVKGQRQHFSQPTTGGANL